MTNSSLDLSARADLAWLAALIGDAQRAVPSVEWLIVGALARDLHLSYAHGIPVDRVTTDTDLALAATDCASISVPGSREGSVRELIAGSNDLIRQHLREGTHSIDSLHLIDLAMPGQTLPISCIDRGDVVVTPDLHG